LGIAGIVLHSKIESGETRAADPMINA
jgi:hypothetical protein